MHTWNVYNNIVNIHINKKQPWQKNNTNSKQTLLLWWANDIPFFNFALQIICWINKMLKYCVFLHLLIWLLNSFCKYRHILWFLTFDKNQLTEKIFQKKNSVIYIHNKICITCVVPVMISSDNRHHQLTFQNHVWPHVRMEGLNYSLDSCGFLKLICIDPQNNVNI